MCDASSARCRRPPPAPPQQAAQQAAYTITASATTARSEPPAKVQHVALCRVMMHVKPCCSGTYDVATWQCNATGRTTSLRGLTPSATADAIRTVVACDADTSTRNVAGAVWSHGRTVCMTNDCRATASCTSCAARCKSHVVCCALHVAVAGHVLYAANAERAR